MVAAITDRQWNTLCEVTGTAEAMAKLREESGAALEDEVGRYHARAALAEVLKPWFADRGLAQIREAFAGTGVIWGPFQTFRQLLDEDPRCSLDNPLFGLLDQPGIGPHLAPHSPLAFGAAPRGGPALAPKLGAQTEEVLGDVLGLSSGEIGKLFDAGLVAAAD
jgi:2-methylfumaryl-CoA isomerase